MPRRIRRRTTKLVARPASQPTIAATRMIHGSDVRLDPKTHAILTSLGVVDDEGDDDDERHPAVETELVGAVAQPLAAHRGRSRNRLAGSGRLWRRLDAPAGIRNCNDAASLAWTVNLDLRPRPRALT